MRKLFAGFFIIIISASLAAAPNTAPVGVKPVAHANQPTAIKKKLKVVTTLSVIASLVREIGGDLVEVNSLSSATEDPHFVKAKPTFKRMVSEADLFMQIGRSLELWVPLVIGSAANPKLSGAGVVSVSEGVKALEVPSTLSREHGDIHPQGNPHIWLSPTGGLKMAENIKNALTSADAANRTVYEKNFLAFKKKLAEALFGAELVKSMGSIDFLWRLHEGRKLKDYLDKHKKTVGGFMKMAEAIDYPFITYHSVFSYMADEFGLKIFAQIEEKPGVPPSLKYQNELIKRAKVNLVTHIVDASYYIGSSKLIELIAQGISGRKMFVDVDCHSGESYIAMINRILKSLVDFKGAAPAVKNSAAKKV